jgi:hypothetical protein
MCIELNDGAMYKEYFNCASELKNILCSFNERTAPGILRRLLVSPRDSALLVAFVAPLDVLCSVRQTRMSRGVDVAFAATGFANHSVDGYCSFNERRP